LIAGRGKDNRIAGAGEYPVIATGIRSARSTLALVVNGNIFEHFCGKLAFNTTAQRLLGQCRAGE